MTSESGTVETGDSHGTIMLLDQRHKVTGSQTVVATGKAVSKWVVFDSQTVRTTGKAVNEWVVFDSQTDRTTWKAVSGWCLTPRQTGQQARQ